MKRKLYLNISLFTGLLVVFMNAHAASANFDIGASNWSGSFPGAGTYNMTINGMHVTGIAERIIAVNSDPTAVYSGNDNPAIARNYSYTFPAGSTVSIDFSHLTVASGTNTPESVGNFSISPSFSTLGNGHSLLGLNLELAGSSTAAITNTSTLTWVNISALNFDIANNGHVSFISHKNMRVIAATPQPILVPASSNLGIILLILFTIILTIWVRPIKR